MLRIIFLIQLDNKFLNCACKPQGLISEQLKMKNKQENLEKK